MTERVVRAAGGVVLRRDPQRGTLVAVVHRPKYDDWSLPKGKLHRGEDEPEAAIREVLEETGLGCRIERDLGLVRYADRLGRPKEVRYYVMVCDDGSFTPTDEVDEIRWLPLDEAAELLTYGRDAGLLRSLIDEVPA